MLVSHVLVTNVVCSEKYDMYGEKDIRTCYVNQHYLINASKL